MEITYIGNNEIKIKGKHASIGINPHDKSVEINGAIPLGNPKDIKVPDGVITIDGPGEYEVGGIKISGLRAGSETVYYLLVDEVLILIGTLKSLESAHAKLTEAQIVLAQVTDTTNASFITGFTPNVVLFYGENAEETSKLLAKDGSQKMAKYQVTADKLPVEMTTIVLN